MYTDAPQQEVDVAVFEPPLDRDGLWSVTSLEQAVAHFGYAPRDTIPRRDQVLIFQAVSKAIVCKKQQLVHEGDYATVKMLDTNITLLKAAFQQLQIRDIHAENERQQALYDSASRTVLQSAEQLVMQGQHNIEEVCFSKEEALAKMQAIQYENLELKLSWAPPQRIKYSRHFLELQQVTPSVSAA